MKHIVETLLNINVRSFVSPFEDCRVSRPFPFINYVYILPFHFKSWTMPAIHTDRFKNTFFNRIVFKYNVAL